MIDTVLECQRRADSSSDIDCQLRGRTVARFTASFNLKFDFRNLQRLRTLDLRASSILCTHEETARERCVNANDAYYSSTERTGPFRDFFQARGSTLRELRPLIEM